MLFLTTTQLSSCKPIDCVAIPTYNAPIEKIFSLLNFQWADERNMLTVENVNLLFIVLCNMKNITCRPIQY